jgi:parallel beta-helix repeat protein
MRVSSAVLCLIGAASAFLFHFPAQAQSGSRVCEIPDEITSSITLRADCIYEAPLSLRTSGVTLDCAGAVIDASNANVGILIHGRSLHDITVKNCNVEGAKNEGILIRPPMGANELAELPVPDRYLIAAKDILIESSTVTNSGNVGIYVGHYSQNTKIRDSTVAGSGGPAVYLDASSVQTTIQANEFTANGFGGRAADAKKRDREAIAIDSSSHNSIINNVFRQNSAGGIFIYKNCWERHRDPKQAPRWMHSSFNLIQGNQFEEKVGVWIASRQAKNQANMDCGDPPIAPGYFRDYAEHNSVVANLFRGGDTGLNVQDDLTTIENNVFSGQKGACVILGAEMRDALLGAPIDKTSLAGNKCSKGLGGGYVTKGTSSFWKCSDNLIDDVPFACQKPR